MQLFTRGIQMRGRPATVGAHATALRDHVAKNTGLDIGLWSIMFGAPVGTFAYTARVDGLTGYERMTAALSGDAEWDALVAKGAEMVVGPPVDSLREPLTPDMADAPAVGSVATVTTAVITGGRYTEATSWGLDIAAHATQVTGEPVMFMMDMFGTFGQVSWIVSSPSCVEADALNSKLNTDAGYMDKLNASRGLFVDGHSHRSIALRIA